MADAELGFFLSGGVGNHNPALSLGGPPSATAIDDATNNLFADVTGDQVASGYTDHRCFYVVNDSPNTYADVKVWIDYEYTGGSSVEMGLKVADEVQTLAFTSGASGGTFCLLVDSYTTNPISFTTAPAALAANIQAAIRLLPNGRDAVVTPLTSLTYQITFGGENAGHKYPLLVVTSNLITPSSNNPVTVKEVTAGSPVNLVAPDTGNPTTAPAGIVFSSPNQDQPFVIGRLNPTEVFGVWVRRITDPESDPVALDGLRVKLAADLLLA
jgi:hypothetical protein